MDENLRKSMEAEALKSLAESAKATPVALKSLAARLDRIEAVLAGGAPVQAASTVGSEIAGLAELKEAVDRMSVVVGRSFAAISDIADAIEAMSSGDDAPAEPRKAAGRTAKAGR